MTGKLFRSGLAMCLSVILLCTLLLLVVMTERNERESYRQLEAEAGYVAQGMELMGEDFLWALEAPYQRITWIAADGTVLYDSVADETVMENHADREEFRLALAEGEGTAKHGSNTLLEKTLYYAVLLEDGTVLRLSSTHISMGVMLIQILQPVLWVVLAAMVLAGLLASRLSKQIIRPINALDLEDPHTDQIYQELWPLVTRIREQNLTIHRQMEELRHRQREFNALIANMGEGVLLLDQKFNILSGNRAAMTFLGEESLPETLRPDRCRPELWETANKALAGRPGEAMVREDTRMMEIIASSVTASGQVTGAMIFMVDVTEREERDSLRREFSANVSHELKTPLTAISGFAELMKEGMVDPETMKEFAGDIYKECGQLIALVDDIMKLSRLDEGAPQVATELVDLYTLSGDILDSLRTTAVKQAVTMTLEGDHQTIYGVWRILQEMIYNLCENAIKYNKEGGKVTVRVTGDAQSVTLSVADTGIGISKGQQERVFERFYRVDKSHNRRISGTGLGLSIVKHGAQFHNAQLTLDSEPGVGTTITLTFRKEAMP